MTSGGSLSLSDPIQETQQCFFLSNSGEGGEEGRRERGYCQQHRTVHLSFHRPIFCPETALDRMPPWGSTQRKSTLNNDKSTL